MRTAGKSLLDTLEKENEFVTTDPWVSRDPDVQRETGGDWYRLLLSAALRGKAVHGSNTAPSCEVLCKSDMNRESTGEFGMLHWDDTVITESVLGNDISDKFYTHQPYRGNITASGSILAYESGMWEPSVRRRARSSALLAAGLNVHGKSTDEACAIVSRITSEAVDIEAVDSALIPASHLKREMVLVSKASHRVFSRGTIQQGIIWNDSRLSSRAEAKNMAFDWGRFTAIARYIGEANIQNCDTFRMIARVKGVPFAVVRDSWAYVSDVDYHLPLGIFDSVPLVSLDKYKIPSLIGAFTGHEQDVIMALNRGGKYASIIPEGEVFGAYLQLMNDARQRTERRARHVIPESHTAREVRIESHSLSEEELHERLSGGEIISDAFLMAIASARLSDDVFDTLLLKIVRDYRAGQENGEEIDDASRRMYSRSTWVIARAIAEESLKEPDGEVSAERAQLLDRVTTRMTRLKANIVGHTTHLTTETYISGHRLEALREQTVTYAEKSVRGQVEVTYSQRSLASSHIRAAASALSNISRSEVTLLQQLRDEVAVVYDGWYNSVAEDSDDGLKENLAYYAYAQAFLHGISTNICLQRASGYIEGTEPRKSFVYQGLLKTAPEYNFVPPRLKRFVYSHASQIADELDNSGVVPYPVRTATEKVIAIADKVVGELMLGRIWRPDPETYLDDCSEFGRPLSPGYDDASVREAEDEARLAAFFYGFEEEHTNAFERNYEDCLKSYPTRKLAEEIAVANGFPNLRAAYDMHGIDFYYTETNPFVLKAMPVIGQRNMATGEDEEKGASTRKRKYDAIM